MPDAATVPRVDLQGLSVPRLLIGLWQVADLEREGGAGLDQARAVADLQAYCDAGLTAFDMADHYGSAELLFGELCARVNSAVGFTKWVPQPGAAHATAAAVDAAVRRALTRMGVARLPLLQFHTWDYCDGPGTWLTQLKLLAAHESIGGI